MGRKKKYQFDQLVHLGVALFRQGGYHATGSQEIVKALGVPKGTFYSHFKSKEQYALLVIERYIKDTEQFMNRMLYQSNVSSPANRLLEFYEALAYFFTTEGCAYGCLLNNFSLEVAHTSPTLRQAIVAGHQRFITQIQPCVLLAQERKEFVTELDSWDLTYALHTAFDGAIVKMKGAGHHYPLKHFLEVTFPLLTKLEITANEDL